MYTRLFDFVAKNEILSPHQYGFRPNRSTYMAIEMTFIAKLLMT